MPAAAKPRLLITGVSGGQGRLLSALLKDDYEVHGFDRATPAEPLPDVHFHLADIMSRKGENQVRAVRPDAVIHLAQVRHFRTDSATRHRVNVEGTHRLLDLCINHGVKKMVIFSSSYVYGAFAENPLYMDETAPLNAARTNPYIRDLVEVDSLASLYLWKYPQLETVILRPVNTLGTHVHSAIGQFLLSPVVVTPLGFDPMCQFLHEEDLSAAVVATLKPGVRGIFNVSGPGAVPLSVAVRECGAVPLALPEAPLRQTVGWLFQRHVFPFPPTSLDFLKYPCTVDDGLLRETTGYAPKRSLGEIFAAAREARRDKLQELPPWAVKGIDMFLTRH